MLEPVSIVIPAFNEEASIKNIIEQVDTVLTQAGITHEIIVVDDGSMDRTYGEAKGTSARVIQHKKNRGYGAALKTGIKAAQYEMIVMTDADGTYPIDKIPEIMEKLQTADMVVGARVKSKVAIPMIRRPAKWILVRLAEYITGDDIPDLNSGLRTFRRQLIQPYLSLLPDKFSFTTTLTVAALCDNLKTVYVPIDYYKRLGKSKIVPWNFVNFIVLVLRMSMLFHPLKVFVPISLVCFLLGAGKLLSDIIAAILAAEKFTLFIFITEPMLSISALLLLLFGLQIMLIGMMSDGIVMARKMGRQNQM